MRARVCVRVLKHFGTIIYRMAGPSWQPFFRSVRFAPTILPVRIVHYGLARYRIPLQWAHFSGCTVGSHFSGRTVATLTLQPKPFDQRKRFALQLFVE